jgi:hypothetical protein
LSPEDALLAFDQWCLNPNGYAWRNDRLGVGAKHVYLHRAVLGLVPGDGLYVDHINRNRLDNRRENLRRVTPAESRQNTPSIGKSSRYRGVSFDRRRGLWIAQAHLEGRLHHLGRFDTEIEAAMAARAWRLEHMPFTVEADVQA